MFVAILQLNSGEANSVLWPSPLVVVDCVVNADPDWIHPAGKQQLQTGARVVSKCHKGESVPESLTLIYNACCLVNTNILCACANSVTYPPGSRAPGSTAGPWTSRTCCCGWPERSATSFLHQGATSPSLSVHSEGSQGDLREPKWWTVD